MLIKLYVEKIQKNMYKALNIKIENVLQWVTKVFNQSMYVHTHTCYLQNEWSCVVMATKSASI